MAYSKVPKACRDYAVGFQDVNQVGANYGASFDALWPEHGTSNLAPEIHGHPWAQLGRHATPKIPRLVGRFTINPIRGFTFVQSSLPFDCTARFSYAAVGTYYVEVFDLLRYYVVAQCEVTASTQHRFVTSERGTALAFAPEGYIVRTYEGTAWALTDFTWHLFVFGTTDT